MQRRQFLGYSSILAAAACGATSFSLFSCKKEQANNLHFDAIVIGSGFGGAVTALRLSEKGVKTLLIEWGKMYDTSNSDNVFSPNLPPDKRSTWLQKTSELPFGINLSWNEKYVGVLDRLEYPNMNVYRNICFGGGSISNGGVLLQPTEQNFNQFMFNDIPYAELNLKYFPLVRQMLSASQMPTDLFNSSYYKFSQVAKRHAQNAGYAITHADSFYNFDIWRKETLGQIKKSALNGELLYGNNNGIKNTLDKNYIAQALGTGNLTVRTLTKVDDISVLNNNNYNLKVSSIDESGNTIFDQNLTSKYLFICAGSVGSTELLVKAQAKNTLPNLNNNIGKFWGPNGNSFAIRNNINEATGNMHSSPPTLSILDYNNPISPCAAMQDIFPIGIDLRILLMVGQPYVETQGAFVYDNVKQNATLNWPANGMDQGTQAMRHFINNLNAVNGGGIDTTFIPTGISNSFTYHPLGGVVLGKASDNYGRLKGYDNLYCLDGAMLPGNCAMVNPSLTIAALAERNIQKIIEEDF